VLTIFKKIYSITRRPIVKDLMKNRSTLSRHKLGAMVIAMAAQEKFLALSAINGLRMASLSSS
jgi:hypothetical protein